MRELERRELRQLRQRTTVRCHHINAMNRKETAQTSCIASAAVSGEIAY
ncbi:hypothetical protein HS125_20115 [bacterium]|nr:hypothetical protein [bacterium]